VLHRQPRLIDQAKVAGFFSFLTVRAKTIRISFPRIKRLLRIKCPLRIK